MAEPIGRMITLLARKSQMYVGSALSKYDITVAEQPFFMAVQRCEGITQEELTALVCVDKAVTARAVRSLERKGFVIRVRDERDRRQNLVYATDKAKQLAGAVSCELLRFNELLTRGIAQEDVAVISAGLQKMEENFSNLLIGKSAAPENGGQNHGTMGSSAAK